VTEGARWDRPGALFHKYHYAAAPLHFPQMFRTRLSATAV
jgi:hypothetical protein